MHFRVARPRVLKLNYIGLHRVRGGTAATLRPRLLSTAGTGVFTPATYIIFCAGCGSTIFVVVVPWIGNQRAPSEGRRKNRSNKIIDFIRRDRTRASLAHAKKSTAANKKYKY